MTPFLLLWLGATVACVFPARFMCRALCKRLGRERPNFQGDIIPASSGLTHLLLCPVAFTALTQLPDVPPQTRQTATLLLVACAFGLLGLIDDLYGSRAVGGFKGHIKALFIGKPTTGSLKLVGGGIVALWLGILHNGFAPFALTDAALIALAANALNLLDVRPGRAQFGFAVLALPTLFVGGLPAVLVAFPLLASVAVEWKADRTARAMMGDTGSNLLGACAGVLLCVHLPAYGRLIALALLLSLNLLSEQTSLSGLIERNPALRALDRRLGIRGKLQPDRSNSSQVF